MATTSALTPSQAIRSVSSNSISNNSSSNNNNSSNRVAADSPPAGGNETQPRGRQRRRNNKKKNNNSEKDEANKIDEKSPAAATANKKRKPRNNKKKGKNNNNNNNNNNDNDDDDDNNKEGENEPQSENQSGPNGNGNKQQQPQKKKNNRKRNNKNRKRFPWRKHIPAGTVDPITLENLISLPYPPFALRAAAPYLPVPEWPPSFVEENEDGSTDNKLKKEVDAKERERRLLQEQWGNNATAALSKDDNESKPPAVGTSSGQEEGGRIVGEEVVNPKHLNLFDGRALAYYMVSQLQFIDPLNRRDLTRDELCHLDRYLVRNNFTDLNVVEAYDTKGVSLSTAGAAANSAAGRAEILQQEARVLLSALFGGGSASLPAPSSSSSNSNTLMQQYSNYQAAQSHQEGQNPRHPGGRGQRQQQQPSSNPSYFTSSEEAEMGRGIYGDEEGGLIVVDDDRARVDPSIRGAAGQGGPQPHLGSGHATFWSPGHITGTANASNLQPQNFPALSTTNTVSPGRSQLNSEAPAFVPPGGAPPSSAAGAQPATTARKPAASKNKKPLPPAKSLKFITKAVKKTTPEETQRQFEAREEARRKAMLSNLTFGSNPTSYSATADASSSSASASLPQPTEGMLERNRALADAFGLGGSPTVKANSWARPTNVGGNVVLYPDALILTAREKMGILAKLERKWKTFLEDDKSASLPLNHMDRETRAFVHQYSDFWKLHTESFDPEPKRYIHCVKLMDTCTPYPLLSDAARDWRGPTGRTASSMPEHASQQTAGQETGGMGPVTIDLPSNNPRATAMLSSERTKLQLKERSLPLELPPFQPPPPAAAAAVAAAALEEEEQIRRKAKIAEKERREQEREERKQRALEAAFASDDEEESLGEMDADSDWEEGEALYNSGIDDEE